MGDEVQREEVGEESDPDIEKDNDELEWYIPSEPNINQDYVETEPVIHSDDWKYGEWSGNIWVITNSKRCTWIEDLLLSCCFSIVNIGEGEGHRFDILGDGSFKNKVSACSWVIFCFDKDTWKSEWCDDMKLLIEYYNMKNVLFVFGGDETANISSKVELTVQSWNEDQKYRHKTVHFADEDIACGTYLKDKIGKLKEWLNRPRHEKVRIFSRSGEDDYNWLKLLLRSDSFQRHVQPSYISNNGYGQFIKDVYDCSFGILYHTKSRGRINVTNVTDSLYDEELEYMSTKLGKSKVIVVVDDLEDGSEEQKDQILAAQTSIEEKAEDLLLFTKPEKLCLDKLRTLINFVNGGEKNQTE